MAKKSQKLWIKTPYPYDKKGEGVWTECTTPWMRYLFKWTKLPKHKGENPPEDNA